MRKTVKGVAAILLCIALVFGVLCFAGFTVNAETDYYAPITADGGEALLGQLHDLMCSTHSKYTTYDGDCRNATTVAKTDPGSKSGKVTEFYSQADIDASWGAGAVGTWNREHCWCQSLSNGLWGTSGGGADLHHIRPVETRLNSTRNNNLYGEISNRDSNKAYYKDKSGNTVALGGYCAGGVFEPIDSVKGDVARIVMYVYMHYNTYSNVGGTKDDSKCKTFGDLKFSFVMAPSNEDDAIAMLLDWNESDPVSENEITRNEAVYKIQGNRNPFIDHPEYADAIWGDGTGGDSTGELRTLSLTPSKVELSIGQSKKLTLSATPLSADKSVSWTTSNDGVATVSNGTVTATGEGTATITATSTVKPSIKATAQVDVKSGTSKSITITRDSFGSQSGAYTFVDFTQDGVSGFAYLYPNNTSAMQFNKTQSSYYIATNTPTPAKITSVKAVLDSKTTSAKSWKLWTSDSPYGKVDKKPSSGKDWGAQSVTTDGVVWTVSGDYTYFALTYEDSNACYLKSVEVSYYDSEGNPDAPPEVALESLTMSSSQKTCEIGDKFNLYVTGLPSAADLTVNWTTSNGAVATVSDSGEVQAKGAGTAIIYATSVKFPNIKAQCTVTVNATPVVDVNPEIDITSLSLNYSAKDCEVGDTFVLYATASPEGADNSVEWTTSDGTVATVSQGQVHALKAGTVTITATSTKNTNIKAVCTVTISNKPTLPDHKKIAAFYNAVAAIPSKGELTKRWEMIATALDVYAALTDMEKQASADYYDTLAVSIMAYNEDIAKLNGEKTSVDNNALKGAA